MPDAGASLTEQDLLEDLRAHAFAPSNGPTLIGLEVEQLAFHGIQTTPLTLIMEALEPLVTLGELQKITAEGKPPTYASGDSCLTFEPGGQLEIVSPPRESAVAALRDIAHLETLLDGALTWRGIRRANHGMTPWQGVNEISLQTSLPRYRSMHSYFSEIGPDGARMMRLSCAIQINVGSGSADQVQQRWRLANLMSPVLIGMFANSPMAEGRVTGWKSTRAGVVASMDPSRTGMVCGSDGPADYLKFALNAGVLLRRTPVGYIAGVPSLTFGDWLHGGDTWGYPTLEDWHYHLSTLWPMVRPRGFLELRAMDTSPVRWRSVPVAVVSALVLDAAAGEAALELLEPTGNRWETLSAASAHDGLENPEVSKLAQQLMQLARSSFDRLPVDWLDQSIIDDVRAFDEQYTSRGRCPADDLLDLHQPELKAARRAPDNFPYGPLFPGRRRLSPGHSMNTHVQGLERERTRERGGRIEDIRARLEDARARTWQIIEPLSDENARKQHNPLMSPLVWDLAHIGNFEELWLVQELGKLPSINALYDQIYDAFKNPRREREKLPLLNRQECREYLAAVRERALAHLDQIDLDAPDPLTHDGYVFEMIIQHEYQHDETMLATLQLMAEPGYRPEIPPIRAGSMPQQEMVLVDSGPFIMGTTDRAAAYDNERLPHQIDLPAFWIDSVPVTNQAYLRFVEAGGYRRTELWAPEGQAWLEQSGAVAPQFWEQRPDGWWVNTFGYWLPLNPNQPVQHVCFWEADACARWMGKRLPTEAEWEKAASWDPAAERKSMFPWGDEAPTPDLANLDQLNWQPSEVGAHPRGSSTYGCQQMIGDVWEWVNSDFLPYPGFEAFPYKEYSEVFFGSDYKILRGGSWAVRPGAIRNTFRNWDYPIRRQIFSGFRCARDA